MDEQKELYSIQGVEIFSAGTWNGDEYTMEDLHGMVYAFDKHKHAVRPFLKLGHDENQKLLQNDGLPAAGWIDKLYVKGEKLCADFCDIPKKIFELISNKAYRKVSSEIYWNTKIGQDFHKHLLGAVALLGADTPGVMNLSDILAMYKAMGYQELKSYASLDRVDIKLCEYAETINKQEDKMSTEQDEVLKKLEVENEELKKFKTEVEAKKIDEQKKIDDLEAELARFRKEADEAKLEKFCLELKTEKLITPAMEPLVKEFLGPDKKEYALNDKKLSKEELLKEMLKLYSAKDVNLVENSSSGVKQEPKKDEVENEAAELAAKEKISFGQAVKRIIANKKEIKQ